MIVRSFYLLNSLTSGRQHLFSHNPWNPTHSYLPTKVETATVASLKTSRPPRPPIAHVPRPPLQRGPCYTSHIPRPIPALPYIIVSHRFKPPTPEPTKRPAGIARKEKRKPRWRSLRLHFRRFFRSKSRPHGNDEQIRQKRKQKTVGSAIPDESEDIEGTVSCFGTGRRKERYY